MRHDEIRASGSYQRVGVYRLLKLPESPKAGSTVCSSSLDHSSGRKIESFHL
jgi:hypothetical protein